MASPAWRPLRDLGRWPEVLVERWLSDAPVCAGRQTCTGGSMQNGTRPGFVAVRCSGDADHRLPVCAVRGDRQGLGNQPLSLSMR